MLYWFDWFFVVVVVYHGPRWTNTYRIQAGKYQEALELLKTALKIEEKELGARPHRMVELYALMAEIYDEVLPVFINSKRPIFIGNVATYN